MPAPLVSVIMPAFNAEHYIQEAIESVIAQTFSNWELIVVDDGSTDRTSEIINHYKAADDRVKSFYQENGKQGKARNLAILNAKGSLLAFLDADDLWLPEKLEVQLAEITEKNVDLVFSDSYVFYDNDSSDRSSRMHTLTGFLKGEETLKKFLEFNQIPNLTVLAKKSKVLEVESFSENTNITRAEDYHLWLKMLIAGHHFYGSDKILAAYRIHTNSSTLTDRLVTRQIPTVFFDIAQVFPHTSPLLKKAINSKFYLLYTRFSFTKSELDQVIAEHCLYLEKQALAPLFKSLNFVLGTRITKRILRQFLDGQN